MKQPNPTPHQRQEEPWTEKEEEIYRKGMNEGMKIAHKLLLERTEFYMGKAMFEAAKQHAKELWLEACEQCSVQNCKMPVASKFLCKKHYNSKYVSKKRHENS